MNFSFLTVKYYLHFKDKVIFSEMIANYCENHKKTLNTLHGQNAEVQNIKGSGTCSYHSVLGT